MTSTSNSSAGLAATSFFGRTESYSYILYQHTVPYSKKGIKKGIRWLKLAEDLCACNICNTPEVPSSTTSTNGESTEGHSIVWTTWMLRSCSVPYGEVLKYCQVI